MQCPESPAARALNSFSARAWPTVYCAIERGQREMPNEHGRGGQAQDRGAVPRARWSRSDSSDSLSIASSPAPPKKQRSRIWSGGSAMREFRADESARGHAASLGLGTRNPMTGALAVELGCAKIERHDAPRS